MSRPKLKRSQQPDLQLVQSEAPRRFTPPPPLAPKTSAQRRLLLALEHQTLVVCRGSAGVGKTYVTLAWAAEQLRRNAIERLIISRPLIGTDGEERTIGALPGDIAMKTGVWALPMLDILEERLGKGHLSSLLGHDRIRFSPLAYMRGSSFRDSFVLVTECQNATPKQVKMLLTRVGEGTTLVLDGDPKQGDLKGMNGLDDAISRLDGLPGVGVVEFVREDVVRSGFCRAVLERYDE